MKFRYIFLALTSFALPCCSVESFDNSFIDNKVENHLVSFYTAGGSFVKSQIIEDGKLATKPDNPVKKDYKFLNWYTTIDYQGEPFNFNEPIIHDLKLYAKWDADFFFFTFKSNTQTCKVHNSYFYQEKIKKYRNDARFVVKADEGRLLNKIENLPDGVDYEINADRDTGILTIENMDRNYYINAETYVAGNVTFSFNGNDTCLIDGESSLTETFPAGEVNKIYYIKPIDHYNIPTEEELNIECDKSLVDYKYEDGVLTIKSIFGNLKMKSTPTHAGYKVFAYANNSTFKIDRLYEDQDYTIFDGLIKKNDLQGQKDLVFKLTLDNEYEIDSDHIIAKIDGIEKSVKCTQQEDGTYKVVVENLNGDLFIAFRPKLKAYKTVTVEFKNESFYSYDLYFNGKYVSEPSIKVDIPTDSGEGDQNDFFLPLEVRVNDDTLMACSENGVEVTRDSPAEDVEVFAKQSFNGTETCLCLINFKGVSETVHVKLRKSAGVKRILNNCSFNLINKFSETGNPESYTTIGDTKQVILKENGADQPFAHTVRIIGFNHDKFSYDTSKTVGITFDFSTLLTHSDGSLIIKNWGSTRISNNSPIRYDENEVDKFLRNDFSNMLPNDLTKNVKTVSKHIHNVKTSEYDIDRAFFTPAIREYNLGSDSDGKQKSYEYYLNNSVKKGAANQDSSEMKYSNYFSSSSSTDPASDYYILVGSDGKAKYNDSGNVNEALAPGFCI